MQKLITYSRGIDEILNLSGLDDWALVNAGFKCNACSQTITYYHMVEDLMIELWLMLDSSAMHVVKLSHITTWLTEGSLRKKICQVPSEIWKQALFVIWTVKTIKKYADLKATRNEETKVIKNGRKCSINWAGIAYTTLYFSKSRKSYKHHANVNSCGGLVGTKNHIARFP